ncbi:MAG: hypothetical protein ACK4ZO_13880, partial [Cyanobacteriota bacterium]
ALEDGPDLGLGAEGGRADDPCGFEGAERAGAVPGWAEPCGGAPTFFATPAAPSGAELGAEGRGAGGASTEVGF